MGRACFISSRVTKCLKKKKRGISNKKMSFHKNKANEIEKKNSAKAAHT